MISPASQLAALLAKDFLLESRRAEEVVALITIVGLVGLAVALGVSGPLALAAEAQSKALAVSVGQVFSLYLAGVLSGFLVTLREAERGTLDALKIAPLPSSVLFTGKLLYTYLLTTGLGLSYLLLASLLSSFYGALNPYYAASVLVVGLYFSVASSLCSFILVYSEARGLLSAVVMAGLVLPALQASTRLLALSALGAPDPGGLTAMLAASLFFAVAACALSRVVLEA